MASNPPQLQLEDQTDEDFFDKLVDEEDDFGGPTKSTATTSGSADSKFLGASNDSDSDDAKAFSNLTIMDSGIGKKEKTDAEEKSGAKEKPDLKQKIDTGSVAESRSDSNTDSAIGSNNDKSKDKIDDGLKLKEASDSLSRKNSGSGVKEVGWSSLFGDSTEQNEKQGFGSYSDFFGDLGGNPAEFPGKVEEDVSSNANGEAKIVAGKEDHKGDSVIDSSVTHGNLGQNQESQAFGAQQNGHDLSSVEYWESLYPGWKYDPNTGQWYQVDATSAQMGNLDATSDINSNVISERTELTYLKQSAPSVVETVEETSVTESVSNWDSQVSQGNNNCYPQHMVFDPQYPGWYYDTNAQEWRSLESYSSSLQSTAQALEQQSQNGVASIGAYSNSSKDLLSDFVVADNNRLESNGNQNQQGIQADNQNHGSRDLGNLNQLGSRAENISNYKQQGLNMWQPEAPAHAFAVPNFGQIQQVDSYFASKSPVNNQVDAQKSFNSIGTVPSHDKASQGYGEANGVVAFRSFVPSGNLDHQFNHTYSKQNEQTQFSSDYNSSQKPVNVAHQSFQSGYQNSYSPNVGRSSAGRPPHALVTFGFGGKLIVMKDSSSLQSSTYGNQDQAGGSISVLNLMEVVTGNTNDSIVGVGSHDYFHALCQQSFPGPLVGGSLGSKELNKWIDERIANSESPDMDYRKGEILKLLLSLLKIACQHYGKLRSPFGTDTTSWESDTPESAVAKLFASAKRNLIQYGALSHCLQNLPSESQIRVTASEVQTLLVSGRKKEALHCAQEGQLWGPALILASQLGDQFYVETVKQMAVRQLVAGSPLRTLCLLIAGQPADVFATDTPADAGLAGLPGAMHMSPQPAQFGPNGMLDDWEENLAVITANRTKDDELVIIHLGDCLWKDRSEILAAHICYLVAEANFESYSDTARLCLIGADHWKFPRTYASPDAIQRTELYEYSKVLGNSQFILLPFQPYKLIYAHMLAEVGKVSDSLKYCQAVLKALKTGRAPEVETWKNVVLSLEDRIRIHQQGGYSANLAPGRLVGKLLNFFDSTAHRVVGGLPPPAPSTSHGVQSNEQYQQPMGPRVSASQSTMAMSSLMPSASMEPISDWSADGNRMTMSNRSVSEPDFGRTPRQVDASAEATSSSAQNKASGSGGASRFTRFGFGSGLLQKTVGLVLRPRGDKQAKLGEKNKFYYDEKLKRWVEEGVEPPAEEAALPPPPTTASFQNGTSDYNLKSALKSESSPSNGSQAFNSPTPSEHTSGIPPIPTSTNQFSARGRMGVRSRYVDTFNQGHASPAKSFQSPAVPSVKPPAAGNPKFFVPTPTLPAERPMESIAESAQEENATNEKPSTSSMTDQSFHFPTPSPPPPSSSMPMQRFPSMDDIPKDGVVTNGNNSSVPPHSRRTASWSGSFSDSFNSPPSMMQTTPPREAPGMPPSFTPSPVKSGSFGDDLHEVEL